MWFVFNTHGAQSSCPTGYFGTNCNEYKCFGVLYNEATVCSLRGNCSAPNNTCTCSSGYFGLLCENTERYEISTVAGSSSGFSGDSGPATSAKLKIPYGILISPTGEIYISDTSNHAIRKVLLDGTIVTFAGTPTAPGSSGDGGQALSAKFTNPKGIFLQILIFTLWIR